MDLLWISLCIIGYLSSSAVSCGIIYGTDADDEDLLVIAAMFGPIALVILILWGVGYLTAKITRSLRK